MALPIQSEPGEHATTLQATILRLAQEAGFAHAGIAAVSSDPSAQRAYFEEWIDLGYAGEMDYLKRRNAQGELLRSSLTAAAPWARSVIVCAAPYDAEPPRSIDPAPAGSGWIARYAWSGMPDPSGALRPADYHKVLLARLKQLEAALHRECESNLKPAIASRSADRACTPTGVDSTLQSWAYVDTGPVIERAWAELAGVGWTGKNTCTLNQSLGSFFFLGVILTSLEVPFAARATLAPDRCGSCTRCLEACPTNALVEPHRMDASRCISYLTIEKRGAIAEQLRGGIGRQVFGCDICQDVCPWNNMPHASRPIAADPVLKSRPELVNPSLAWLAQLTEDEFGRAFYGSPVKRTRYAGLRRNVAIAMGNSGQQSFVPQLTQWVEDPDEVLAESARWALERLARVNT